MADEDYIGTLGEKSTRWQRILFYANEITDDVYELIAYKFSPVEAPKTGSFWGEGWDFHVDPSLLDWQIAYGLVHHIDHYVRLHAARLEDRVNEIWCDATCIECHMAWAPIMTSERIMSRLQKEAEKRFGAAFNSTSNRDKILEELWMPPGMNFAKFFGIKEPDDAEHIYDLIKDKYQVQNNQVTALNGPQGGGGGKDKQQGGGGQGQEGKDKQQGSGGGQGQEGKDKQQGSGGGQGQEGKDKQEGGGGQGDKDQEGEGQEQGGGGQGDGQQLPQRFSGSPCRIDLSDFDSSGEQYKELMEDVAQKIASGKLAGTEPGNMLRAATEEEAKHVPWQHLALALLPPRGYEDYSFRPRPRDLTIYGGGLMPRLQEGKPSVGMAVDVSGSISGDDLAQIYNLIKGVYMEGYEPQVAGGDTEMTYPEEGQMGTWEELVDLANEKKGIKGGGGTDMGVLAWQAYIKQEYPETFILITDGYTPWVSRDYPRTLDGIEYTSMPPNIIIFIIGQGDLSHLIREMPEELQSRTVAVPSLREGRYL